MGAVASLFLLVGLTCSLAFPDIDSGSITAYLRSTYPDQPWFDICNGLVVVAVFLTFPLQLTPAVEVLDEWFGPGCEPRCWTSSCIGGRRSRGTRRPTRRIDAQQIQQEDPDQFYDEDEEDVMSNGDIDLAVADDQDVSTLEVPQRGSTRPKVGAVLDDEDEEVARDGGHFRLYETPTSSPTPSQDHHLDLPRTDTCFGDREWIFRRWMMVVGCALVVLLVNDLAVLVTLFGAVGQTGLAFMPCAIHLKLQQQSIVPRSTLLSFLDGCTIAFSVTVMVTGLFFSVQAVIEEKAT
jgi:hypothetical protein